MTATRWLSGCLVGLLALLGPCAHAYEPVLFDDFEYVGHDKAFEQPLTPGSFRNPVLAGFYPDPSVVRVGEHYYLVNSSFAYFPGIPVFESRDLVHWTPIGHVIDRPSELSFDGLGMSRGVFAPAISYHDGTFYVVNTAVDNGGNFIATARNPAGPWSDPIWLRDVQGIDPSLFFDDDGKAYLLNNDAPEGKPLYEGHRAIWLQQIDLKQGKPIGSRKVVLNGGTDLAKKPIWIEGPHLYKRDGWYYLMCAEGGTGPQHSEVVLRSRSVWGPFVSYEGNPILTQRDLAADRADPIVNAGHADLVEAADGSWWAIFLASRAYGGTHYNTGRETFLLPVTWKDGWPTILPHGQVIPTVAKGPAFLQRDLPQEPLSGNFHWRDAFDKTTLDPAWLYVRVPKQDWADLRSHPGKLAIHPLAADLDTLGNPSFLARRQQHLAFEASTSLVVPAEAGVEAGIAAFQNEHYWYAMGVQRSGGQLVLSLRRHRGEDSTLVAKTVLPAATTQLKLQIAGDGGNYSFAYDGGAGWQWLGRDEDGTVLSTDVAGGFIGAVVGPYARQLGND
ncbi:glycoside hydrolase family 43 protein [Dyella solisilvae]|uniref:Glycoside hydrolase family 43 protein n=1 Tax=Dyella solisilvae TaxID=1920168 RepID=A0A370K8C8_9GAMM|nr:glycoside hydrolase family 43 protein [Dyella solisilvae]RDI98912.1 glycoside hydrolase family 43 protein [Dyella solisilvae]